MINTTARLKIKLNLAVMEVIVQRYSDTLGIGLGKSFVPSGQKKISLKSAGFTVIIWIHFGF
jgi:hypothetical protein